VAVVATLSKGYDLDYIWKHVDRGPVKDAASYYIQASETGGEPPGRWWGPGAQALGFEPGQRVEREPYDLLFGQRKDPGGSPLGRPPDGGRKAADVYKLLLAAEPDATAGRRRELRVEATRTGSHNTRVHGRETGQWHEADLAVAHWLQHTSRDGDMQLHVHSQIAHVARTATDGKWRAPDSLGYTEHVGAAGAGACPGRPGLYLLSVK
jgi:TrwC relaxase